MFILSDYLTENLINGVKRGVIDVTHAALKVGDWVLKGMITPEQAEHIATEAVYVPPVITAEVPFDEPILDPETGLPIEPVVEEPVVEV